MSNTRSHAPIARAMEAAGVNVYAKMERASLSGTSILAMSDPEREKWMRGRQESLDRLKDRKAKRRMGIVDGKGAGTDVGVGATPGAVGNVGGNAEVVEVIVQVEGGEIVPKKEIQINVETITTTMSTPPQTPTIPPTTSSSSLLLAIEDPSDPQIDTPLSEEASSAPETPPLPLSETPTPPSAQQERKMRRRRGDLGSGGCREAIYADGQICPWGGGHGSCGIIGGLIGQGSVEAEAGTAFPCCGGKMFDFGVHDVGVGGGENVGVDDLAAQMRKSGNTFGRDEDDEEDEDEEEAEEDEEDDDEEDDDDDEVVDVNVDVIGAHTAEPSLDISEEEWSLSSMGRPGRSRLSFECP